MVNKKYIPQLPETTTPILSGYTVYDDGVVTYKVSLDTLSDLVNTKDINFITGGTFIGNTLTLNDIKGQPINIEILNFNSVVSNVISGRTLYGDGSNLTGIEDVRITSGSYNPTDASLTLSNNIGEEILITGFTSDSKYWFTNENNFINYDETMVISNDLILENSNLFVHNLNENIIIGNQVFYKRGQVFIGGNLVLINSNITNNGLINVAGSIILNGDSTIIGTGIIN